MRLVATRSDRHLSKALDKAGISCAFPDFDKVFDHEDYDHPRDYPLLRLAKEHDADVVILIDPILSLESGELFGYWTGWCRKLRNEGVTLVMFPRNDPETWSRFKGRRVRACAARPSDAHIYMTTSEQAARESASGRRTVLLHPQPRHWVATDLVRAIEDFKSKRSYSPRRDSKLYFFES